MQSDIKRPSMPDDSEIERLSPPVRDALRRAKEASAAFVDISDRLDRLERTAVLANAPLTTAH